MIIHHNAVVIYRSLCINKATTTFRRAAVISPQWKLETGTGLEWHGMELLLNGNRLAGRWKSGLFEPHGQKYLISQDDILIS